MAVCAFSDKCILVEVYNEISQFKIKPKYKNESLNIKTLLESIFPKSRIVKLGKIKDSNQATIEDDSDKRANEPNFGVLGKTK